MILCAVTAALPSRADSAETRALFVGDAKKGDVAVKTANGSLLVALDQVVSALGFIQSPASGGVVVTFNGKKIEFWSGASVARIGTSVYPLAAAVTSEGGHFWGESVSSLNAFDQFLEATGRPKGLSLKETTTTTTTTTTTVVPSSKSPAPTSPTTNGTSTVRLMGIRWGQQTDGYRAVIDLTGEVVVTAKESAGRLELTLPGVTVVSSVPGVPGTFPNNVKAQTSSASGKTSVVFTHGAKSVKSFWLQNPTRYVIDFMSVGTLPSQPVTTTATVTPTPQQPAAPTAPVKINTTPEPSVSTPAKPEKTDIVLSPTGSGAKKKYLVVVDAGHGGHDPGASGFNLKEKDINLKAAQQLASRLQARGLEVRMTRNTDVYLKLAERTEIANNADADAFVSLHCNALPKGKHANGIEVYLMAPPSDKDAMSLAVFENKELSEGASSTAGAEAASDQKTKLLLKILGDMQQNDKINESTTMTEDLYANIKTKGLSVRKVRQAPFFVLRGAAMPAVLVEMGYITEKSDASLLNSQAYREKLVDALAQGVMDYLNKNGR